MKTLKNLSPEAAGVILSLVIIIASVGATFGITQHQINNHEQALEEMDAQYSKDHDILLEIKRDVHWMRQAIESKTK